MTQDTSTVVSSLKRTFGGTRILDGQSAVTLWSDGVVIASAWSLIDQRLDGRIYTFRGTITRSPSYQRTVEWTLRDERGEWIDTFASRRRAVEVALGRGEMEAFRALNEIERPKHTINGLTKEQAPDLFTYGRTHDMDCPACQDTPFTASPRSETYWAS